MVRVAAFVGAVLFLASARAEEVKAIALLALSGLSSFLRYSRSKFFPFVKYLSIHKLL
jgi:hypothetical protein